MIAQPQLTNSHILIQQGTSFISVLAGKYSQQVMASKIINKIGILRIALMSIVLVCIMLSFFSDGQVAYSGWAMVPTLLAPALTPIVFFGLAFDVMMSSILFADNVDEVRSRFKLILFFEITLLIALFISWLPYFLSIGS